AEGVEIVVLEASLSVRVHPIAKVPVPEMKKPPRDVADTAPHGVEVGPGPGEVMVPPSPTHARSPRRLVELAKGRAQDGPVRTSENTRVVNAVLLKHLPATRPGQPTGPRFLGP